MAGNHHLARRVEVNRLHDLAVCHVSANLCERVVVETQHRRHGADPGGHGRLHEFGSTLHHAHGVRKIDATGGNEG